jgi:hypothetical protein
LTATDSYATFTYDNSAALVYGGLGTDIPTTKVPFRVASGSKTVKPSSSSAYTFLVTSYATATSTVTVVVYNGGSHDSTYDNECISCLEASEFYCSTNNQCYTSATDAACTSMLTDGNQCKNTAALLSSECTTKITTTTAPAGQISTITLNMAPQTSCTFDMTATGAYATFTYGNDALVYVASGSTPSVKTAN